MMIGCLSDGYILFADGPYFAHEDNDDAAILKSMLKNPVMLSFFQLADCIGVDRGFRDVVDETKSHGIDAARLKSVRARDAGKNLSGRSSSE
ncbi:hypothetical protein ILUMI_04689 [Ignelater luminosus]|uniref:Uncharacterized protein n=1 Tax=Ignelater luminosus TaxID=2038154 RepID=A0A8K0DDU5_IGNLU|nr:hypothetical protein ILUMI_04689 [Ignelater luminosus]